MKVVLSIDVDMGEDLEEHDYDSVADALAGVDAEEALREVIGVCTGLEPEALTIIDYRRSR